MDLPMLGPQPLGVEESGALLHRGYAELREHLFNNDVCPRWASVDGYHPVNYTPVELADLLGYRVLPADHYRCRRLVTQE